jgi:glycosyltransferase involved in cell wall biosynthesis
MKLLYVADGRSPIALNWISHFVNAGYEVHLASSFRCSPPLSLASVHYTPVAMSELRSTTSPEKKRGRAIQWLPVGIRTALRRWLGPLTLIKASKNLCQVIAQIQPDLVHAMRIPFEGMLAAQAMLDDVRPPLVVSVWGNDFTLHAPSTPLMSHYTRMTLHRADALHADCQRDVRLAHQWDFKPEKKAIVLPGAGGVQLDVFYPTDYEQEHSSQSQYFYIINPRGVRSYIRNDTFFRAARLVYEQLPQIRLLCPGMAGEPQAEQLVDDLKLRDVVELLPAQTRPQMAELFRRAQVAISPSEHDGTPNTLLEAMASGCFPIAGDIESIREWIDPGVNGLLFNPGDPQELAAKILESAHQEHLRKAAKDYNLQMIANRGEYRGVMRKAEAFYQSLV